MKNNDYRKNYYLISDDEVYEIEGMLSIFVCALWEIVEKGVDGPVPPASKRKKFYELLEKHIGKLF